MMLPADWQEIKYNPGIFGFVKGCRHETSAALVMSRWEEENKDWVAVYWVKRLVHNAVPIATTCFSLATKQTIIAAERVYELSLLDGPPHDAISDYQRNRVYLWEENIIFPGAQEISWEECQNFVHSVWQEVGKGPEPLLYNTLRYNNPISFGGVIHLPPNSVFYTKPILLHELSHELKFYDKHGPEFVSTYIDLCARYVGMDRKTLICKAVDYGVMYK